MWIVFTFAIWIGATFAVLQTKELAIEKRKIFFASSCIFVGFTAFQLLASKIILGNLH